MQMVPRFLQGVPWTFASRSRQGQSAAGGEPLTLPSTAGKHIPASDQLTDGIVVEPPAEEAPPAPALPPDEAPPPSATLPAEDVAPPEDASPKVAHEVLFVSLELPEHLGLNDHVVIADERIHGLPE